MRPAKPTTKSKAAGLARARLLLRADLGWLRGFPTTRRGAVEWTVVPEIGSSHTVEQLTVMGTHLQRVTRTANRLRRDFPRALPALVGDPDRWRRRLDARLDLLKPSVHHGAAVPSAAELVGDVHGGRIARQVARARASHPTIARLIDALCWVHAGDDRSLARAWERAADLAEPLGGLLTRAMPPVQSLFLAVRIVDLAVAEGTDRVQPLVTALGDARVHEVPLTGDREAAETIAQLRKGKAAPWPAPRPALLGRRVTDFTDWLCAAPPKPRRRALSLWRLLTPAPYVNRWARWWANHGRLVKEARGHLMITPLAPTQSKRLTEIAGELRRQADRMPPAINVPYLVDEIQRVAQTDDRLVRAMVKVLEGLHREARRCPVRMPFFLLWSYALACDYSPREVERLVTAFGRFVASQPQPLDALAPWSDYWRSRPAASHPYTVLDLRLLRVEDPRIVARFYTALALGYQRAGSEAGKRWSSYRPVRLLIELCELTEDAARAEALVHQLGQTGLVDADLYIPTEALKTALDLCPGADERFAPLVEVLCRAKLPDIGYTDDDPLGLAGECADHAMAALLAGRVLDGEVKRLHRLGGRLRLLQALGAQRVRYVPPNRQHRRPPWTDRYPRELHPLLRSLASVDPEAEHTAAQTVGKLFPEPQALRTEMAAIQARIAEGRRSATATARLETRLTNLRRRLREPPKPSPRRMASCQQKLARAVEHQSLACWERSLDRAVARALAPELALATLPRWITEEPCLSLLPHLGGLPAKSRRLAFRLLRTRAGPFPWDLREADANQRFIAKLADRGIDPAPWLEGIGTVVRQGASQTVYLQLERDPLEVLLMGKHFDTCLSPGWFNFFSAVSNAADINKRVLYGRDERGTVVGRCLLALTDDGSVLTFHPYCHDGSLGFQEMVSDFVLELCGRLGSTPVTSGEVSLLVAPDWYDDGPVDVTGRFAAFDHDSPFCQRLYELAEDEVVTALQAELQPLALNGVTIPMVLRLAPIQARPRLVVPLLDLIGDHPELSLTEKARAAELAWRGGAEGAARRLLAREVLPRAERWTSPERPLTTSTLELLVDMGEPSLVLRLLHRMRERGVRRWSDEPNRWRVYVAARAHQALHRRKLAASLYRQGLGDDSTAELRERCEERLAELGG